MSVRSPISGLLCLGVFFGAGPWKAAADDPPAEAVEFFGKEVRPVLANRFQGCHGPEKQKGGLRLDSREAILQGGDTGPAVVPGQPAESPLVEAINYGELDQMPPKSKLPALEIAALTRWVQMGAPWTPAPAHIKPRRRHS